MVVERLSIEGHLLDEHKLSHVLSKLDDHGVAFIVRRFRIGEHAGDESLIDLELHAADAASLEAALDACREFGVSVSLEDAVIVEAEQDGVLPEGFYSTTNFPTYVRVDGEYVEVERLEMDCGIRVWREVGRWRAETCPMHRVRKGDALIVGFAGIKVVPPIEEDAPEDEFRFMINEVSSERPKGRLIKLCAKAVRQAKTKGAKVLLVGGPAIVHSGCAGVLEELILDGWIDVLFAGNALAAHDIEAAMMGTSLGVDLGEGVPVPHGHTHHLRAINRVRRAGSIAAAVEQGLIPRGVMRACVSKPIPFVLCGSIRDDGPLPEVITDVVKGQDAMREHIPGVSVAILCATTLHSVATGNILPAVVKTFCVDSDADTVIKLTDRGTHQAIGIVTDVEFFLKELAAELGVRERRS
jgi:lysine-ketoglutarate reductase/saccharopine dehydrogenase-like protein (TIGR00300 family)